MISLNQPLLKGKSDGTFETLPQSKVATSLRKQVSLPSIPNHINPKQLYPCKSWNELARQTEEKKKKRILNNQLKSELQKFFEADDIMETSKPAKSLNQRANKRMSTQRNQSKSLINKKNSQSSNRLQKLPPIKIQQKEGNFIPRKGGLKPPRFLADLEIQDSNSQAFKSIVPQSPMTPSSIQRSTPKQTPRSQIVPSKLNSNKYSQSNRDLIINRYTEPDSPVQKLLTLRSESSQHNPYEQQDANYEKLKIDGIKSPQYPKQKNNGRASDETNLRSKDRNSKQDSGVVVANSGNLSSQKEDILEEKESHLKNIEMLREMQRRLGSQQSEYYNDTEENDSEQPIQISITNVEYLRRPNQLQIIDQVEDQKSFNQRFPHSQDGRLHHIPLSVVKEKPDLEYNDQLFVNDIFPMRFSNDGQLNAFYDQQQALKQLKNSQKNSQSSFQKEIIKQCSSKQLLKNPQIKQTLNNNQILQPAQNYKKKQAYSLLLEASHSSVKSKQEDINLPSLQVTTASVHQKQKILPHEDIEMSPIERSKASGIPDQIDNSISKQFGFQWFTPKHEKRNQSIDKLSPIYDQNPSLSIASGSKSQRKDDGYQLYKYSPLNPSKVSNFSKTNSANNNFLKPSTESNFLSIKQKSTTYTKGFQKEHHNLVPTASTNLDLKEFSYKHINPINNQINRTQPAINSFGGSNIAMPLLTQPVESSRKNSINGIVPKKQLIDHFPRRFSLNLSTLNFAPTINNLTTPLNITPAQPNNNFNIDKSRTSLISVQGFNHLREPRSTHFTPSSSPLNSHRPSGNLGSMTQRNSTSAKKNKGIKLWINNFHETSDRSRSPVEDRIKVIKYKKSLERMNDLQKGIFRSRSKSRTDNTIFQSPKKNMQNSTNLGSLIVDEQSIRRKSGLSPSKALIKLGNKNNLTDQSPTKESSKKPGIKLSCEFKKHKYQQKGVVRHLN